MKTKPPPDRRRFTDARDEMDYLCRKLLYWLYDREDRSRALAFATRLSRMLTHSCAPAGAIFPEGCRSLICEAHGDLSGAIEHRQHEIRLIKQLHRGSRNSAFQDNILSLYGYEDLSDRLDLLASLYHENGQREKAIETLKESADLCAEHGIPFDGNDMLCEYLNESKRAHNGKAMHHHPISLRKSSNK